MSAKEFSFSTAIASVGTIMSAALGGWDIALRVLITLMIVDYATGFLGAIKTKTVNSDEMFWGGIRKGIIFAVLIVAVQLDEMVGNQEPIFRTMAIYFYAGREGISVTENLGVLGVYMPPGITKVLKQLQDRGEGK